jgi:carboxylesterase
MAVLVHGFTGSPYDMKELADFLFEHGIDVGVVRIAGHGTHISDLMQTNYDHWIQSAHDFIDQITESRKRIFLVGYSFGSNLALDLASREPHRYKGIVCLGASIYWHRRFYYYFFYHIFKALGIKKVRKPYVPKYKVESWESTGNYAEFPTNGLGEFRDMITERTIKLLPNVIVPALIIHSRGDRISHPRSSEYLFEHIGSTYKEMFVLPELNHNPLRSENKDKIFERVLRFIES